MIKLKPLSLSLLFALSFVCSMLISPIANAASVFDDTYNTTDALNINTDYYGTSCAAEDIATTWASYITDDSKWVTAGGYVPDREAEQASFLAALESGAWGVTHQTHIEGADHTQRDEVIVFWTENVTSAVITFEELTPTYRAARATGENMHRLRIGSEYAHTGVGSPSNCAPKVFEAFQDDAAIWISDNDTSGTSPNHHRTNFFANNFTVIYPENYEGVTVRQSAVISSTQYPALEYIVQNKKVTLLYKNNLVGGCVIDWAWRQQLESDPQPPLSDIVSQPSTQEFVVNVNDYGKYMFIADLKYFGPPAICAEFQDGATVLPTILTLEIDGRDYSGSTDDMDCEDGGEFSGCLPPSPFEDCSTYGADLVGGFGCVMRNFMVGFEVTLKYLFVPNQAAMTQQLNTLKDGFNNQMGFLLAPFTFLAGILQATIDTPTSSGCSVHLGNVLGNDSTVDPCTLSEQIPLLFDFLRIVVQAGVLFMVMSGLMAKYHEVLKA